MRLMIIEIARDHKKARVGPVLCTGFGSDLPHEALDKVLRKKSSSLAQTLYFFKKINL